MFTSQVKNKQYKTMGAMRLFLRTVRLRTKRSFSKDLKEVKSGVNRSALLKGTHARDFHSLFLNFSSHISVTNRYKTQSS
jgi:hypothetical protein